MERLGLILLDGPQPDEPAQGCQRNGGNCVYNHGPGRQPEGNQRQYRAKHADSHDLETRKPAREARSDIASRNWGNKQGEKGTE